MIVYGRNVAKEMLNSNKKIKCEILDKKEFSRFDKFSHQGIILDVEDFVYTDLNEIISVSDATIVILDHLEDPHNLGAIIRTCEAAGITGIILPKDRSVSVNSTVMKTSAGALENVKISMVTNLNQTIKELKEKGFWIVGTDMNGQDYRTIDYSGKIAIIIGNEGKGMSSIISSNCDFIAEIPMYGKINSLNASVAAGIIIYEAIRSKR